MTFFALPTPRLILRDFVAADLADMYAIRSDSEVARFMDFAPETREQTRAWLTAAIVHNRRRPRRAYNLAIADQATGRAIGWIGFGIGSNRPDGDDDVVVGYMVARAQWGRDYASEALRAVIAYCFGALLARRVHAWCWAENRASARVMEKAGMRFEREYDQMEPKSGLPTACREYAIGRDQHVAASSGTVVGPSPD